VREPRWRGEPGRLEVWYSTVTDPITGTGLWLHTELVAPTDGAAYVHGWAAVFPVDAAPTWERFGPGPFDGASPDELSGTTKRLSWDLRRTDADSRPLYTFPRYAWERGLLPAAQVVPSPTATYDGIVRIGEQVLELSAAPGASARIYGHGSAKRWGWLHADLGNGDVLEVVSAVSTRPGLKALPPLTFRQLRVDGVDRPRDPLLQAPLLRARLGLPTWRVRGPIDHRHRITVDVSQDPQRSVQIGYTDPDGATATCHNTELATVDVRLDRLTARGWQPQRSWHLDRTAHAEIGVRP
jgi:hypothetical protein